MRLTRKRRVGLIIAMTPLVDVMFIMLIFFMVTSSYLDLDMIPLVQSGTPPGAGTQAPAQRPSTAPVDQARSLLVRLGADGGMAVSGQRVNLRALRGIVSVRLATRPETKVLVLPSGAASTQSLVSLIDTLALAGAEDVRVIRLEVE